VRGHGRIGFQRGETQVSHEEKIIYWVMRGDEAPAPLPRDVGAPSLEVPKAVDELWAA